MKISRSVTYALVATGYIAENQQDGPVMALRIAKEYDIPVEYLLKILKQLAKAKVLQSKRGPRGGFLLARKPEKITMFQIIEAIEGPIARTLNIAKQTHGADFGVKMENVCKKVAEDAVKTYGSAKLSEMLN